MNGGSCWCDKPSVSPEYSYIRMQNESFPPDQRRLRENHLTTRRFSPPRGLLESFCVRSWDNLGVSREYAIGGRGVRVSVR